MRIHKETDSSLRVELTAGELQEHQLSYELLNYQDKRTRQLFKTLLESAGRLSGFSAKGGKLLIEVYPAPEKGCTVYFTRLNSTARRYRKKPPEIFSFDSCEAMLGGLSTMTAEAPLKSELYLLADQYILILHQNPGHSLGEYGTSLSPGRLSLAYIREHGKLLASPFAVNQVLDTGLGQ